MFTKWLARLGHRVFGDSLVQIDEAAAANANSPLGRRADYKVIWVLVTVAVSLTLQEYLGGANGYWKVLAFREALGLVNLSEWRRGAQIDELTYWTGGCIVAYFVIPALVIKFVFRERIRDYGTKLRGAFTSLGVYAGMLVIVLFLVFLVSATKSFQAKYPFYNLEVDEKLWPNFIRWEIQYAFQFLALEFFFRGFMVHGTKHRFGTYSVYVMTVPYCMIHFGKPLPETFAAIIAGIALGLMSLKTRSIWMGAILHIAVAWTMDWTALWRKGLIP